MRFVEIPQSIYRQLAPPGDERTDLYRSNNRIIRWIFWERLRQITRLIKVSGVSGDCLDFGGGTGVLLPTLTAHFDEVCCMDLDARLARSIASEFNLQNVSILESDVSCPATSLYDAIIAADVLEHFKDLDMPVDAIERRLMPGGWLFTSLPTETWLYELIRKLIGKTKPADHYHSADAVEAFLRARGFRRWLHVSIPHAELVPLFSISAWVFHGKS